MLEGKEAVPCAAEQINQILDDADAVLIGAGAGLSASAGFTYSGGRFRRHFHDFEEAYGFHDMYSGGFYPYSTKEEYWAYWSRYIYLNQYEDAPKPVYDELRRIVSGKEYFVITTNVDHCFQKAGFDKKRLFYTQGDYGLFQCSGPCCRKTYDNRLWIERMVKEQSHMKIPPALIPRCPVCGKDMTVNLRSDYRFVEDDGWHAAAKRYEAFLCRYGKARMVLLELGVGYNTPGIIKYPFWQMTAANKQAAYICINDGEAVCPRDIMGQSVCVNEDIGAVLHRMKQLV